MKVLEFKLQKKIFREYGEYLDLISDKEIAGLLARLYSKYRDLKCTPREAEFRALWDADQYLDEVYERRENELDY